MRAKAVIIVPALVVLAGACVRIAGQVEDLLPQAPAAGGSKASREATPSVPVLGFPDRPQDRSTVVIGKEGTRAVVSLSKTRALGEDQEVYFEGLLCREIFREALLIAARDGLGASIRDEMLGEPVASRASGTEVEFHYSIDRNTRISLSLRRPGEGGEVLWKADFDPPPVKTLPVGLILGKVEPLTRAGLVDALEKLGGSRAASKGPGVGTVPEAVARSLDRMTFVSQYSAIRALSAAAPSGPSAEQLGALARGYANLGLLTEHHWNASHKAFEARALLYSQRLVALHPDSPWSYWSRAYALGVIGLHGDALSDLAEADRRLAELAVDVRPAPPPWAVLVKHLCEFDTKALLSACSDPARAPLASTFALMSVEGSKTTGLTLEVARAARRANPDCLWVNDAAGRVRKLSHLHLATVEGLELFEEVAPRELRGFAGLPAEAARHLRAEGWDEVGVTRALDAAGSPGRDPVEPSWAVLGRIVREARFAQVARRVEFMATMWSVPVDDFVNEVRSLVSDHPFWPLVQSFTVDRRLDGGATLDRLSRLPSDELEHTERFYIQTLERLGAPMDDLSRNPNYGSAYAHGDFVARDRTATLPSRTREGRLINARQLLRVSPHSPAGMAAWIELSWDEARASRPDLEGHHAQHPEVLVALGKHYAQEKRPEDAERLIAAAIKISPDQESYAVLASIYKDLGRMDRWKETLDLFLTEEDPGLDHARVRVELARYFMGKQEYDKAKPYAEAAAETWAEWAMRCAAECDELMGDWERAELWYGRISDRYPHSQADWFFFCARTGRGDRAGAADLMERHIADLGESATLRDQDHFGTYYILVKQPRKALDTYTKLAEQAGADPSANAEKMFALVHIAVLADELGDPGLRDRTLEGLATSQAQQAPRMSRICALLHDWLARPKPEPPDLGPIDEVFGLMPNPGKGSFGYFVGRLLERHGLPKEARKYYRYGVDFPKTPYLARYLSANALRDQGLEAGLDGKP